MTKKPIISYLTWSIGGKQVLGGIRVILEQTHRLLERGYQVNIITHQATDIPWYDSKIKPYVIAPFSRDIPKTDILVATYWPTAYEVANIENVRKYYLVQHYEPLFESNNINHELAKNSYRLPLEKLTVSQWISAQLKNECGQPSRCISNAIDPNRFQTITKTLPKTPGKTNILAVVADALRWKGTEELFSIFKKIRDIRSDVEITFITSDRKISAHQQRLVDNLVISPEQHELMAHYQKADIFLHTSYYEGFGLPPLEAMAAKTCVVAVDSGGINEYAIHNENALIVPSRDYEALFLSLYFLLDRPAIAQKLAENAYATSQRFTWDTVIDRMETIFREDS